MCPDLCAEEKQKKKKNEAQLKMIEYSRFSPRGARAPHVRLSALPTPFCPFLLLLGFSRGISTSVFHFSSSTSWNSAESARPPRASRTETERLVTRVFVETMRLLLRATHRDDAAAEAASVGTEFLFPPLPKCF